MTEETTVPATENAELNDEQVEQFFENGGELPAEETPEPEQPAEEEKKEDEKEKFVPYGALHEERQRRKELQAEIERVRQEQQQSSQVMQQVLQQIKQQQQPQAPDPEADPVAYFQHKIAEQEQQIQQLTQYLQGNAQQTQQQQQQVQLVTAYRSSAAEFAQQAPDFTDAYSHLVKSRITEYEALGYSNQEAKGIVQQEEMQIAAKAFQDGVNPAQRIYELAKMRGYQKPVSQEQKMQTLEKGVKASKPTGGAPQGGEITLEALAEAADSMTADEFNALWSKFARGAN